MIQFFILIMCHSIILILLLIISIIQLTIISAIGWKFLQIDQQITRAKNTASEVGDFVISGGPQKLYKGYHLAKNLGWPGWPDWGVKWNWWKNDHH